MLPIGPATQIRKRGMTIQFKSLVSELQTLFNAVIVAFGISVN